MVPSRAPLLTAAEVSIALRAYASDAKAESALRFFKTSPGSYGEHDRFLGITVPEQRRTARAARGLTSRELASLLRSPWHEERLTALFVLVDAYERAEPRGRAAWVSFYLEHLDCVNNWDLVDSSAWQLLGRELRASARWPDDTLVQARSLWRRRIAMVSSFAWLREGEVGPTLSIAERLLGDPEDLLHKATGWMLRELGKRVGRAELLAFLELHAARMPRTTLRYAVERFSPGDRARWMQRTPASRAPGDTLA